MKSFLKIIFILAFFIIPCILAFLSINTIGCTKTVTEVEHDTTTQNLVECFLLPNESTINFYCEPITDPDSIDAYKKWDNDSLLFTMKSVSHGAVVVTDTLDNNAGITYGITIFSHLGNAVGNITMPESAHIIQPTEGQVLPIGDVTVSWAESQYADFYYLSIIIFSFDTLGNFFNTTYIDTFITEQAYIISSSFFDADSVGRNDVICVLFPHSGPLPTPGTPGNMSGSLNGFIIGRGAYDDIVFYVGAPPKKFSPYLQIQREMLRKESRISYHQTFNTKKE